MARHEEEESGGNSLKSIFDGSKKKDVPEFDSLFLMGMKIL
jgi:hypothetical protein